MFCVRTSCLFTHASSVCIGLRWPHTITLHTYWRTAWMSLSSRKENGDLVIRIGTLNYRVYKRKSVPFCVIFTWKRKSEEEVSILDLHTHTYKHTCIHTQVTPLLGSSRHDEKLTECGGHFILEPIFLTEWSASHLLCGTNQKPLKAF